MATSAFWPKQMKNVCRSFYNLLLNTTWQCPSRVVLLDIYALWCIDSFARNFSYGNHWEQDKTRSMKIAITKIQQLLIRSWIMRVRYANGRVQKEKTRWPSAVLFIKCIQCLRNTHTAETEVEKRRHPGVPACALPLFARTSLKPQFSNL